MSTGKLIRNVESNVFDYKHLAIKRINCQFDNGKTKTSFRASLLAEKDKRITLMLTKLNIPVGRLWLTPDSVKFINYLEKTYFIDDYKYLSSVLGFDLNFAAIHAIISNDAFPLRDENNEMENREYESGIDSGMYVLESVKKMKSPKDKRKTDDKRRIRKSKINPAEVPVRQILYIDPESYKIRKIRMEDSVNSRFLNIGFSDFTDVEKQIYPGEISLHFVSPETNVQLSIRLSGFSMEEENEIGFRVPGNFTRINTN